MFGELGPHRRLIYQLTNTQHIFQCHSSDPAVHIFDYWSKYHLKSSRVATDRVLADQQNSPLVPSAVGKPSSRMMRR